MRQTNLARILTASVAITLALILSAGCKAKPVPISKEGGVKLEFETVKKGDLGWGYNVSGKPEFRVFRTETEWTEFWNESEKRDITSLEEVGGVGPGEPYIDPDPYSEQMTPYNWPDFRQRDMIIGAFFVQGSGYDVSITEVKKLSDKILVSVKGETFDDDRPGFNAPYHIVKLRKSDLPVKFRFEDKR